IERHTIASLRFGAESERSLFVADYDTVSFMRKTLRAASNALRLGEINLRNSKLSVIAQGEKTWEQLSYETSRFLKR
ncbi:MAG TPA: hypothetical protein VIJ87_11915, partial [Pyrinomonadaceae bacterium]